MSNSEKRLYYVTTEKTTNRGTWDEDSIVIATSADQAKMFWAKEHAVDPNADAFKPDGYLVFVGPVMPHCKVGVLKWHRPGGMALDRTREQLALLAAQLLGVEHG